MADVTSSGQSRPREEHLLNDKSQNQVGDKMNILESVLFSVTEVHHTYLCHILKEKA